MKKFLLFLIVIFSLSASIYAQSGRKIQTEPTPATTPVNVQLTETAAQQPEEVGYSESSPNSPIKMTRSSKDSNKDNKKKKKEDKVQPTPTTTPTSNTDENGEEIIKVDTNLVTIPISVTDRNGFYVANLRQSNFQIFEDGVEQEVAYFGATDQPFTVVLLIDVSPSTAYKIEDIRKAAIAFVNQLFPKDQVMVIQFDSSVHVLTELTEDRNKITAAINKADFGNGTSLYDAVDFSIRKRLDKIEGRKAIVLFTDGVDTTSGRATFESTVREAEESEAVIFPIYYNTLLDTLGMGGSGPMSTVGGMGTPGGMGQSREQMRAEYQRGRRYLQDLAEATGGKVFRPDSTPTGLALTFESIAEELRRQYSIGYYPNEVGSPGQRKQIKVRINRPKLIIRARDSYIVGDSAKSGS